MPFKRNMTVFYQEINMLIRKGIPTFFTKSLFQMKWVSGSIPRKHLCICSAHSCLFCYRASKWSVGQMLAFLCKSLLKTSQFISRGIILSKKANSRRLQSIWFHLHNILEMTKLWDEQQINGGQIWRGREGTGVAGSLQGKDRAACDGTALHLTVVSGHVNLHVIKLHRTKYTHVHK